MAVRIKAGHVRADLRKDAHRRKFVDPGDRVEEIDQVGKSGLAGRSRLVEARDASVDFAIDDPDRRVKRVPCAEMELEQKAVTIGQSPV